MAKHDICQEAAVEAVGPFSEDDLIPLSALQHLLFCERQCALIHIEQLWAENRLTIEGHHLHERVDEVGQASRGRIRTVFSLPVRSLILGLSGQADAVEFHREDEGGPDGAVIWRPFPVEYKRGKPKMDDCDLVQICAQALCLEEMLGLEVPEGAMYYGKPRRRLAVVFDDRLRGVTRNAVSRLHELIRSGITPAARYEKKCDSCSLIELCLPKVAGAGKNVRTYVSRMLATSGVAKK
ncbi:MAG: CRISPR-associated protein Cas4 [Proteobacteria bacterium]|nr:CRISPR-associated protein Cas4 [Desulfobulbaceae bacterium]MBU4152767.1 CRISPR-associated protein Cas4 [Pseudomonadota bacterium]MDP2105985.1 CRISPR-associated protein Cas4 [Desulfobulbaceae bacterium]